MYQLSEKILPHMTFWGTADKPRKKHLCWTRSACSAPGIALPLLPVQIYPIAAWIWIRQNIYHICNLSYIMKSSEVLETIFFIQLRVPGGKKFVS